MGCGLVKVSKRTPTITKKVEIEESHAVRDNKFSLYTVKEEMSEMEQSRNASNRGSVLLLPETQGRLSSGNELNVKSQ